MKAPKKIYLRKRCKLPYDVVLNEWYEQPPISIYGNIEYTRTDAFIEKAKEWFIEHVNISQDVATNKDGEPLADSYIKYAKARLDVAKEMFENFKEYIKG